MRLIKQIKIKLNNNNNKAIFAKADKGNSMFIKNKLD
jgi:hypothetical protein